MSQIKVNDYVVARYGGESGDVIAGQVTKIRAGKAYMKNLLTGGDSERGLDIVNRRNIVVPRKDALAVAEIFHSTEDKQKARKEAVSIAHRIKKEEAAKVKTEAAKPADGAVDKTQPKIKTAKVKAAKPAKKMVAPKIVKQKAAKPEKLDVHVQISRGGKVLVDKSYQVKE